MYEQTYDIIDWKSCESCSSNTRDPANSTTHGKKNTTKTTTRHNDEPNISKQTPRRETERPRKRDVATKVSDGSNGSEILFPSLFYEDAESMGSSAVTVVYESWRDESGVPRDMMEEVSVYQKVHNWVASQKMFFRKEEDNNPIIEDDDLEVIDPVDLFHESILDEYLLVTEDDTERRELLRELKEGGGYDIGCVQELMQTHDYKFIRQPKPQLHLEMDRIIEFGDPQYTDDDDSGGPIPPPPTRKKSITSLPDPEDAEDLVQFLGVPRILEKYVILNREGCVVNLDSVPDLWLSPFEENLNPKHEQEESNQSELDFLSSWFSDVYQTDRATSDKIRPTFLTDMLEEKLTVISVCSDDDDEVFVDAPEIPHWLDGETEELELFNQPSRPLYYYRDRIKGCYRIIGVEDETVVLFSGNDDDTIFYTEDNALDPITELKSECSSGSGGETVVESSAGDGMSLYSQYRRIYNRLRYGKKQDHYDNTDTKNDSGIDEDIDDTAGEDTLVPFSVPSEETNGYECVVTSRRQGGSLLGMDPHKESFVECFFVVMGACMVVLTLVLYENGSPLFNMYRSKITEEAYNDLHKFILNLLARSSSHS